MGYVLGGVQFLYTASFDEVISLASQEAVKVAVRTQQILAHELGITNTVDPLGGSYYIETLTSQIEHRLYEILAKAGILGRSPGGDSPRILPERHWGGGESAPAAIRGTRYGLGRS